MYLLCKMLLGIWDMSLAERTQTYRFASCSDTVWVGDPWALQLAPGVFVPCHVQEKEINDIFRHFHTNFHGGNDSSSSSLVPHVSRERSSAICAHSHIMLLAVPCQAEGPSQEDLCRCHQLQALLQSSTCSPQVMQFTLPAY